MSWLKRGTNNNGRFFDSYVNEVNGIISSLSESANSFESVFKSKLVYVLNRCISRIDGGVFILFKEVNPEASKFSEAYDMSSFIMLEGNIDKLLSVYEAVNKVGVEVLRSIVVGMLESDVADKNAVKSLSVLTEGFYSINTSTYTESNEIVEGAIHSINKRLKSNGSYQISKGGSSNLLELLMAISAEDGDLCQCRACAMLAIFKDHDCYTDKQFLDKSKADTKVLIEDLYAELKDATEDKLILEGMDEPSAKHLISIKKFLLDFLGTVK